jgi:hypothetical protein
MLLAMRPDFVALHWDEIGNTIGAALPPTGLNEGMCMNKLLERILAGKVTCWTVTDVNKVIQGFLLTYISEDYCTEIKSLHLYALSGNFTGVEYEDAWKTLLIYAKSKGCRRISGMTAERLMIMRAKMFNWNVDYTYMYKEV